MRTLAILLLAALVMGSATPRAAEMTTVAVGYLEITNDPRYEEKRAYARIRVKPHDRPLPGAEMAIRESRILGRALKIKFSLERGKGKTAADLVGEVKRLSAAGVRYFLVDADAVVLDALAKATADRDLLLFNISEPSDALRAGGCRAHLMHTLPSYAMRADALAQVLIANK